MSTHKAVTQVITTTHLQGSSVDDVVGARLLVDERNEQLAVIDGTRRQGISKPALVIHGDGDGLMAVWCVADQYLRQSVSTQTSSID